MTLSRGTTLCVVLALGLSLNACAARHSAETAGATPAAAATPPSENPRFGGAPTANVAVPRSPVSSRVEHSEPSPPSTPKSTAAANGGATPSAVPARSAILSVNVTPQIAHDGDTVSWDVRTTPDVTSVEAHVRVATIPFTRQAPGHFTMAFTIPKAVPGFFHASYNVDIVGRTGDGETLRRSVPLNFR